VLTVSFLHEHHEAKVHVTCFFLNPSFECHKCVYRLLGSIKPRHKLPERRHELKLCHLCVMRMGTSEAEVKFSLSSKQHEIVDSTQHHTKGACASKSKSSRSLILCQLMTLGTPRHAFVLMNGHVFWL